jgi:hypothetical protein
MGAFATAAPLTPGDVAAVYAAAGLVARDGAFRLEGCPTALRPQPEGIDLAPSVSGVLVYLGTSACFPETQGGNVALFVKDEAGRWVDRFGWLPGVEVIRQPTAEGGWPDLGVANPGGCMPVYRYDGSRYVRHAQKAVQPGGCQFRQ